MVDVVLVHGAASTSRIWRQVVAALSDVDVLAPDRPGTGSLARELDWLESISLGAVVFGMSGGATLALGLAMRGAASPAIIAHEPAAGSLSPELFGPLAHALEVDGVTGFGTALYGPLWRADATVTQDSVREDLAMFRGFEPARASPSARVVVTTGEHSPELRHTIAARLANELGYANETLAGCSHLAALEAPHAVAARIRTALN